MNWQQGICNHSVTRILSICISFAIAFLDRSRLFASPLLCIDTFKCDLADEKKVVSCRDKEIDSVPLCLNPSLVSLSLHDTGIHTLYVIPFMYYVDLKYVDLSQNAISTIDNRTFAYQESLEELRLMDNLIGRLDAEMFIGLKKLTALSLRGNLIEELQEDVFDHLSLLENLDLSHNRITRLYGSTFQGCPRLTVLHLSQNRLQEVPLQSFEPLLHLAELSVGGSSLNLLHKRDFKSLVSLVSLDLSNTALRDRLPIDIFEHIKHIRSLKLNDCQLDHIPTESLSVLTSLESIELNRNLLTMVPEDAFISNSNIQSLTITGNPQLKRIATGALRHNLNLIHLDLSRNGALVYLPNDDLRFLSRLSFLDLHGNALQFFPRSLAEWSDLTSWKIHDNPIWCNCSSSWLREMILRRNTSSSPPIVCANPLELRGVPLAETRIIDLSCGLGPTTQGAIIAISVCALVLLIACTSFLLLYHSGASCIHRLLKGDKKWTRGVGHPSNPRCYDSDYPCIKAVPVTEL